MDSLKTRKLAYTFIALFILSNFLWNIMFQNNLPLLDWGAVTFQIIACLTSIGWFIYTFIKTSKSFWLFLGLGVLSYLIGTLIWSYNAFILNLDGATNTISENFWILQNGFYFIALLIILNKIKSHLLTIRFFLDLLIVMTAATTFSWIFLINPLIHQHTNMMLNISELLYPILDLGVFVGVLSVFFASGSIFSKMTRFLLVSGFLTQIIADSIFIYLNVMNPYSVGSINEPLWILSILLIGLAGIYYIPSPKKETIIKQKRKNKSHFFKIITPYLGVLMLSIYFIALLYKTHPVVLGLFLTILLAILRQILTLLENDKLVNDLNQLNEDLEGKVKERTDKLVETLNSMEYIALHDVVTGLPNRRFMEKRLSQAISNSDVLQQRMAFMMLDLDRFKQINDSLGHSYGDLLLKEVGSRLINCLNQDQFVCRLGGDEFALLIENTNMDEIEAITESLLATLRETYYIKDVELNITPSIGVSVFPDHGNNLDALMMAADTAMYKVKGRGKNDCQIYNGSMSMEPTVKLETSLRKGLERDEFILYYQPQISLINQEIVGAEALIRWERPGYGLVPPSDFIPIAEEMGLILPIGERVLWKACEQSAYWSKKGFTQLRIAVNISSLQFQQNNFIEMVSKIIKETGANPNQIELEITESIAMGPIEQTIAKLNLLKQMGFKIAIDDFGTGYSSLHYLSQFQIDRLKIDRSFISALENSEKDAAIVKLIVLMAKSLNFQVIAEGVENNTQKSFLEDIQCDEIQGYLFSRPVCVEDFERLLG